MIGWWAGFGSLANSSSFPFFVRTSHHETTNYPWTSPPHSLGLSVPSYNDGSVTLRPLPGLPSPAQPCLLGFPVAQRGCGGGPKLDADSNCAVVDIDECALPTGGHICSYRCINIPGSFQCSCPSSGYRLAPNGRNCQGE